MHACARTVARTLLEAWKLPASRHAPLLLAASSSRRNTRALPPALQLSSCWPGPCGPRKERPRTVALSASLRGTAAAGKQQSSEPLLALSTLTVPPTRAAATRHSAVQQRRGGGGTSAHGMGLLPPAAQV